MGLSFKPYPARQNRAHSLDIPISLAIVRTVSYIAVLVIRRLSTPLLSYKYSVAIRSVQIPLSLYSAQCYARKY
ncbi:hypothetical protein NEOLEDRAFT_1130027 [Neolentinus lepideus HHB14362 ss-1]|uniref:Uncharacterized protein n=1 Tax=Neolentinus lepideus HHB14362 ss-1 TaxID=1314782 RepID=A0A165UFD6_9AGAM|nr:hypothetical protein NEOLEDRAFT_1130027 [Neolentinus lepideus HHB14362 ss-1]